MSAALWFYFWPPTWGASAGAATVGETAPARGSGRYTPLDDDYWRLWAARFAPHDATPHAQFDLQAQLVALRERLGSASATAANARQLSASIDSLDSPSLF